MRNLLFTSIFMYTLSLMGQVPQMISFQSVVRDSNHELVAGRQIGLKISILQGSAEGQVVYVETFSPVTNVHGLVSLLIGGGPGFQSINWSNQPYFIKTQLDLNGGENYTIEGISPVISVPYALHAQSAESITGEIRETQDLTNVLVIGNNASGIQIKNLGEPTEVKDATTKGYIDDILAGLMERIDALEEALDMLYDKEVFDIDGNMYPVVLIGNQRWMGKNLRVKRYRDGSVISTQLIDEEWLTTTKGAYAIYTSINIPEITSDDDMSDRYGLLYNGYAVTNEVSICPEGWRVPNSDDWLNLLAYIESRDNVKIGNQLKSCWQIKSPLSDACARTEHPRWEDGSGNLSYGTDDYGFAALPGGMRDGQTGEYSGLGTDGVWWSFAQGNQLPSFSLYYLDGTPESSIHHVRNGFSVRCIKE